MRSGGKTGSVPVRPGAERMTWEMAVVAEGKIPSVRSLACVNRFDHNSSDSQSASYMPLNVP